MVYVWWDILKTSIHDIHKAQNFSSFNEDYQ